MMNAHTDLAIELKEQLEASASDKKGYCFSEEIEAEGKIRISRVEILNKVGERQFGREKGTYITIEVPEIHQGGSDLQKQVVKTIVNQLRSLPIWDKRNILLVGIGNREITSDALGPFAVSSTCVNRHRNIFLNLADSEYNVSALVPGVMSQTGMESSDIIRGVIAETHPDLVIVVDALASRSVHRVNRTVQICNTGIAPGSGLKNNRTALNQASLGIPVIAIGVPTVVSTLTILADLLDVIENGRWKEQVLSGLPEEFARGESDMFVTTKNIDEEVQCLSIIISHAIEVCYGLTEDM